MLKKREHGSGFSNSTIDGKALSTIDILTKQLDRDLDVDRHLYDDGSLDEMRKKS